MKLTDFIKVFSLLLLLLTSCQKEEPKIEGLNVTPNNIAGDWQLVNWRGESLKEPTYFYMSVERKDKKYTFYQNIDSMGDMPHVVTGRYNIIEAPGLGWVIIGEFDYSSGDWSHRYVVEQLTSTEMTWVATDDSEEVKKFVRVQSIPSDIVK